MGYIIYCWLHHMGEVKNLIRVCSTLLCNVLLLVTALLEYNGLYNAGHWQQLRSSYSELRKQEWTMDAITRN